MVEDEWLDATTGATGEEIAALCEANWADDVICCGLAMDCQPNTARPGTSNARLSRGFPTIWATRIRPQRSRLDS